MTPGNYPECIRRDSGTEPGVTLAALATSVGAASVTDSDIVVTGTDIFVTGTADDSREVEPGDLFLALPGAHAHGMQFERRAHARGAVAMLSDRPGTILPTIVVDDPRRWAGPVSAHIHRNPSRSLDVYGVTGTNGKTSTTYLLAAALDALGETVGTITGVSIAGPSGTTTARRTTPEAAQLQRTLAKFRDEGVTASAMEVSSHAVTHRRIDGTRYAVMGFTNLARDHLDFHGTMEQYFAAKSELFTTERTAAAAVGIDDEYGRRLAADAQVPCWTWSTTDHSADIFGDTVECSSTGTRFTARTPLGRFVIELPLLGPHQAANALSALTMVAANGGDLDAAAAGLEKVPAVPGRLERIDVGQPFLALVDYMHNTAGQRRSLPYLRSLTEGRVIVVIGATGDRDPGKRLPLGTVAAALSDLVIVTDESPYSEDAAVIRDAVAAGAMAAKSATVVIEPDRRRAFALATASARPGDVVVVTGRGSDSRQVFGSTVETFDDRVELRNAISDTSHGLLRASPGDTPDDYERKSGYQ